MDATSDKLTLCRGDRIVNSVTTAILLSCTTLQQGAHSAPMSKFDEEVMRDFGTRLKDARLKAGFEHAKDFAEALGVEENRYRHWERGSAQPSLPMLARITRLLKVELSELVPAAYRQRYETAERNKMAG